MTLEQKFQHYRRDRPEDLIFGIVTSILLHVILFLGYYYWLKITPEQKRSQAPPIPIEFVEVPPNPKQVKPPPQTKRRAANDSVAGGKANPQQPISAARLTAPVREQRRLGRLREQRKNIAGREQLATRPAPRTSRSTSRKTTASPTIPKSNLALRQVKIPKSRFPAEPRNEKIEARNNPTPPKSTPERVATRSTAKIPPPAQPSRISGAASRLGGAISVSGRDSKGNYQAALPNSNRFNRGTQGIDARRDVDMGSYLMQLQQRVRQQWIPGLTQNSRRTVVYFAVSRSGQVRGLRVVRPSGSSVTDSAAVGAISRAAPFAPLPSGYSQNYINIRFTFNINVSGQLELGVR
ncbi:MAG TPA: hypothetical protein DEV81_07010 [Cyanobacteria bacterium UBA11049]|nr:hypothetical protein [Cyanobacteria bacterium UBA11049]